MLLGVDPYPTWLPIYPILPTELQHRHHIVRMIATMPVPVSTPLDCKYHAA